MNDRTDKLVNSRFINKENEKMPQGCWSFVLQPPLKKYGLFPARSFINLCCPKLSIGLKGKGRAVWGGAR